MKIASNYPPFGHLVFLEVMLPAQKPKTGVLPGDSFPPEIFYLRCGFFICVVAFFICVVAFFICVVAFFICVVAFFICVVAFSFAL